VTIPVPAGREDCLFEEVKRSRAQRGEP